MPLELLLPASSAFYDHSLRLYEQLGRELNFNVMLRQGGLLTLAHSEHELELPAPLGECHPHE